MRPVRRGMSPKVGDFQPYDTAKPSLISRIGSKLPQGDVISNGYCCYCERPIVTQLAVEHIQPKGLPQYQHLEGRWENFLLACVNCNSTKKNKDVILNDVLLPDRDNTFAAFIYTPDGKVNPSPAAIAAGLANIAANTLALTGLDKNISQITDENGKEVALDRIGQRKQAWLIALEAKADIDADPHNISARKGAIRTAQALGFFSIWLTVFSSDQNMCNSLIDAFAGTRASGCFDPITATIVSPAPNPDGLADGHKF